jgi:hypothetical protein
MRKWYDFLIALLLFGLCLYVLACPYGFGNVLNSDNIACTIWNLLIDAFGS